jgi:hypothetical protein
MLAYELLALITAAIAATVSSDAPSASAMAYA